MYLQDSFLVSVLEEIYIFLYVVVLTAALANNSIILKIIRDLMFQRFKCMYNFKQLFSSLEVSNTLKR